MQLETDKKFIGKIIKDFRKMKNLTQFELAEKIGINEKQISRIEVGLNCPTYITFAKLVEILDINIELFIKNNKESDNMLVQELYHMIKNLSENEIKMYIDIINNIKKNIDNLK